MLRSQIIIKRSYLKTLTSVTLAIHQLTSYPTRSMHLDLSLTVHLPIQVHIHSLESRNLTILFWKCFTALRLSHLLNQLTQLQYHRITIQDFLKQSLGTMNQNRPILTIILITSKSPVTPISKTFIRFKNRMLRQITDHTAHMIYAKKKLTRILSTLIISSMLTKMITN